MLVCYGIFAPYFRPKPPYEKRKKYAHFVIV